MCLSDAFLFVFYSNKKMYPVVLGQSNVRKRTLYLKKHKNNNFTTSTVFKRWWLAPEGTFVSWKQRRLTNRQGDKEQGRSLHCNVKIILQNDILKRQRKTHFRVNTRWRDVWADRLHTPPHPPPPPPACTEFAAPPNHRHYSCLKTCFKTGNQSLSR